MDEDFAERQAIQQCALLAGGDVEDEAERFLLMLRDTPPDESVLLQLNQLGFQKKWATSSALPSRFTSHEVCIDSSLLLHHWHYLCL